MSGENAHGIDVKMRNSAILNQMAIVLNFSLSVISRFAFAEPMVIKTILISITVICSIPKKRICL